MMSHGGGGCWDCSEDTTDCHSSSISASDPSMSLILLLILVLTQPQNCFIWLGDVGRQICFTCGLKQESLIETIRKCSPQLYFGKKLRDGPGEM